MTPFPRPSRLDLAAAGVITAALVAGLTGLTEASLMVAGIALLGWSAWAWPQRPALALATSIIGGWLVVRFFVDDAHSGWIGVIGVLAAVAIAASVGRREQAGVSNRAALACLAISCGGVWACVPETDGPGRLALVLGAAAAAAALAAVEVMDVLIASAAAVVLAAGLAGGQFRASAVVGAVGVMGVLVVAWLVPLVPLRRGLGVPAGLVRDILVVGGHGVNALLAARVAGRGDGLVRPVLVAAVAGVALTVWVSAVTTTKAGR